MSDKLLITFNPPLRCQYKSYCIQQTKYAVIYSNGLLPIRFTMTPVCPTCLIEAARIWGLPIPQEETPCKETG